MNNSSGAGPQRVSPSSGRRRLLPDLPYNLLKALRPHQWVKNLLLAVPLVLAHQLGDTHKLLQVALAIVAFSLVASSVYVVNDLIDIQADRDHPRKRRRPFASGALPVAWGPLLALGLLAAGFGCGAAVNLSVANAVAAYWVASLAYSLWIKRVAIGDVFFLAGLYSWRLLVGGMAARVEVSQWLMAFSMFIFTSLAFAKRHGELADFSQDEALPPERAASRSLASSRRRGYQIDDLGMLEILGACSGYLSVLVLALYVTGDKVQVLYHYPWALWLICLVLLFWISRIWLLARRQQLTDDPLIFAVTDPVSLATALAIVGLGVAAAAPWTSATG